MGDAAAHSRVGASSAKRWMTCPGSVVMSARMPDEPASYYAAEGTAAHTLAEHALFNEWDETRLRDEVGWIRWVDGHSIEITEDMVDAVWTYIEYVRAMSAGASLHLEQRLHMDRHYRLNRRDDELGWTARNVMFGTVDALIVDQTTKCLEVIDYKHGQGLYVPVEGNPQLYYYGLAALLSLPRTAFVNIDSVQITIVQPRHTAGEPIRTEVVDAVGLLEWGRDHLVPAARDAVMQPDDDPTLVPSEECRFCPAAAICPALRRQRMSDAKLAFNEDGSIEPTVDPTELSPADMKNVLESAADIRSWLTAVERQAKAMLEESPDAVPGYKVVHTRPQRRWVDEEEAANRLCEEYGFGDEDIYETRITSPAKIEKIIGKGKDAKALLGELTESVSSGTTIAPEGDSRPAVTPEGSKRVGAQDAFTEEDGGVLE
jgi:hypothetical protein